MAFDATTPFALACLSDSGKSKESLTILTGGKSTEARTQDLLALAKRWNITMSDAEAKEVVAEYERVKTARPAAANVMAASVSSISSISSVSSISSIS